jgi:hypothetical protein
LASARLTTLTLQNVALCAGNRLWTRHLSSLICQLMSKLLARETQIVGAVRRTLTLLALEGGDKPSVDYAGDTVPIILQSADREAEIFAVMDAFNSMERIACLSLARTASMDLSA